MYLRLIASARCQMALFTLVALLHRLPLQRLVAVADRLASTPVPQMMRNAAAVFASLGAYHAVSGASQVVYQTAPASPPNGITGEAYQLVFGVTNTDYTVRSWRVGGSLPPGLLVSDLEKTTFADENGLVQTTFGVVSGVPLVPGSYEFTLQPFRELEGIGDTDDPLVVSVEVFELRLNGEIEGDRLKLSWKGVTGFRIQLQQRAANGSWQDVDAVPEEEDFGFSLLVDVPEAPEGSLFQLEARPE